MRMESPHREEFYTHTKILTSSPRALPQQKIQSTGGRAITRVWRIPYPQGGYPGENLYSPYVGLED